MALACCATFAGFSVFISVTSESSMFKCDASTIQSYPNRLDTSDNRKSLLCASIPPLRERKKKWIQYQKNKTIKKSNDYNSPFFMADIFFCKAIKSGSESDKSGIIVSGKTILRQHVGCCGGSPLLA